MFKCFDEIISHVITCYLVLFLETTLKVIIFIAPFKKLYTKGAKKILLVSSHIIEDI